MTELSVFYSIACFGVFILEVIVNISGKGSAAVFPAAPALCGIAALIFFRRYLKKERKGTQVLLFGALFFALAAAAELKLCSITGVGAWIITLCINAYAIVTAFSLVVSPGKFSSLIGYFDWSLILLFLVLLMENTGSLQVIPPYHFIICALLCGVSLIRNRVFSQNMSPNTGGGALRVTLVTAILMSAAAGLAVLTAKPFGRLLISFTVFLRNIGLAILGLIDRFLIWLSSFMKEPSGSMDFIEGAEQITLSGGEQPPLPSNALVLYLFIALICAALIIVLTLALRNMRFGRLKVSTAVKAKNSSKTNLFALLLQKIRSLIQAAGYRFSLFLRRNTVLGTFYHLEHSLAGTPLARLDGQTPQIFLSGCAAAAAAGENSAAATLLNELTAAVNACLYSRDRGNPVFPGARDIRIWSAEIRHRKNRKSKSPVQLNLRLSEKQQPIE